MRISLIVLIIGSSIVRESISLLSSLYAHRLVRRKLLQISVSVENGVDLTSLVNHVEDALYIKISITDWLNNEFITQAIHEEIGVEAEKVYLANRLAGVVDLGELVINTGTSLESIDFKDAFVDPWR